MNVINMRMKNVKEIDCDFLYCKWQMEVEGSWDHDGSSSICPTPEISGRRS